MQIYPITIRHVSVQAAGSVNTVRDTAEVCDIQLYILARIKAADSSLIHFYQFIEWAFTR